MRTNEKTLPDPDDAKFTTREKDRKIQSTPMRKALADVAKMNVKGEA
jgi:hypothetical protein